MMFSDLVQEGHLLKRIYQRIFIIFRAIDYCWSIDYFLPNSGNSSTLKTPCASIPSFFSKCSSWWRWLSIWWSHQPYPLRIKRCAAAKRTTMMTFLPWAWPNRPARAWWWWAKARARMLPRGPPPVLLLVAQSRVCRRAQLPVLPQRARVWWWAKAWWASEINILRIVASSMVAPFSESHCRSFFIFSSRDFTKNNNRIVPCSRLFIVIHSFAPSWNG